MLTKMTKLSIALLLVSLLGAVSYAQQSAAPQKKEPEYVDFSGFKGKVFEVKNRDPREIVPVISPLGSGFKGATIMASSEHKTITVRDFPENLVTIEEAIKRLDVPAPTKPARPSSPDVEVTAYVLIASNTETANNSYPALLKDVITQLQATLNYKSYTLLTPIVQRTKLENGIIQSNGTATLSDKTLSANYRFSIGQILPELRDTPNSGISLSNLQFSLKGSSGDDQRAIGEADISTRLTIRDGEKVVVGTASLKDKALILVLTVKTVK